MVEEGIYLEGLWGYLASLNVDDMMIFSDFSQFSAKNDVFLEHQCFCINWQQNFE
jgi:hypothetical protein